MISDVELDAMDLSELRSLMGRVVSRINRRFKRGCTPSPLAAMQVGDVLTRPKMLHQSDKDRARRELGQPDAQWTCVTTTKGVRVTRTR